MPSAATAFPGTDFRATSDDINSNGIRSSPQSVPPVATAAVATDDGDGDGIDSDTTAARSDPGEEKKKNNADNHYTIEVKVETTFPSGITVEGAKKGWLEFCWARGGGIVVPTASAGEVATSTTTTPSPPPDNVAAAAEASESEEPPSETTQQPRLKEEDIGVPIRRELMVPLGMKQELVSSTSESDDTIQRNVVTYKTTQRGLFCKDMIEDTHEGRVEFIGASYTSTRMIWTVSFRIEQETAEDDVSKTVLSATAAAPADRGAGNTDSVLGFASTTKSIVEDYSKQFLDSGLKTMLSKANLWGSWSQFQLKTASQNLIAYLDTSADSMPVLEHTETLPVGVSPREAMEAWYAYCWRGGGGVVPVLVPPEQKSNGTKIDTRWVLPTGLEEELVSLEYEHPASESGVVGVDGEITTETEIAKAVYRVNNPNLLTYPVHYHRATVRFIRDGEASPTHLLWRVRVKPYRKFLGGGVLFWTKNGIALASRNLRNHLELQQLEKREKQLQSLLERLRIENPQQGTIPIDDDDGGGADVAEYSIDDYGQGRQQTIRSTVSLSSMVENLGGVIEESPSAAAAVPATTDGNNNNNNKDKHDSGRGGDDNSNDDPNPPQDKPDAMPTASASPGVVVDQKLPSKNSLGNQGGRPTMFIPPRTIGGVATPIEGQSQPVNGERNDGV